MQNYCDLHTHSIFSDGTDAPEALVAKAERLGLSAVALCDHNTVEGLPRFLSAAIHTHVEAVPGIEFSTEYHGKELHILMLYVRPEHYDHIREIMKRWHIRKEQSNRDLVAALQKANLKIDYEEILKKSPQGFVNRAIIGAELVDKGYAESIKEAFERYLTEAKGFYVPPGRLDALETVEMIKVLGGVAVLAHPFLNLNETELRSFLPVAVECGLDAMETMYSKYDDETTRLAAAAAKEFNLLPSGGSDYHGNNKPDIAMGIGKGQLRIPGSILIDLKNRRKN